MYKIIFCMVLFSFSVHAQTERYNELSTGDQEIADRELQRFRNATGAYTFTDEESLLIPEVVRNFINSSDCTIGGASEASFPGLYDWTRNQNQTVDTDSLRCTAGERAGTFKLCSASVVTCSNELVGTIQRQNVVYVIPENESCASGDAKVAMLNAMRIGEFSGGVQGIPSTISIW